MESVTEEPPLGVDIKTRWLKRVLIPFWILRCLVMILFLVAYIAAIYLIHQTLQSRYKGSFLAAVIVLVILLVLCLALDLTSMIMLARHSLKPKTFLIFQVIETTIWLILFVIQIVAAGYGRGNPLSWLLSLILFLSFLGLLIYASVIYHRARKTARRGQHAPPATTAAYEPVQTLTPANPFDNVYSATPSASFEVNGRNMEHPQQQSESTSQFQPNRPTPEVAKLPITQNPTMVRSERYA